MNYGSKSLLTKIILSSLPLLVGMLVTVNAIYQLSAKRDEDTLRAVKIAEVTEMAEVYMVTMSEALRGYMLDVTNTAELDAKKAADAAFVKAMSELAPLVAHSPQLAKLSKEMTEYDENEMNRVENEVIELLAKRDPRAQEFYWKTYMPIRAKQSANFAKFRDLAMAEAHQVLEAAHSKKVANAFWAVLIMTLSFLVGMAVMYTVIVSTIRKIRVITAALSDASGALNESALEVSGSSQTLSQATTEQAASLQETTASLEETNAMVAKNTDNAKRAANSTAESQAKANEGKSAVERMMQSMEEINQSNQDIVAQIDQSNGQMTEIVRLIQEIGTKTKVINDIVFQTKLLSFNASVEAARAGEHGKGFAVVAEEVGNLAQMSGNASKEISEMLSGSIQKVEGIVKDTKSRVDALVSSGKMKVESGIGVAKQCHEVLNEIVENVTSVSVMADEISKASEEQASGIAEINKAVAQLDQTTQQNAATSEQSANAATALTEQSESLSRSVSELVRTIEGSNFSGSTRGSAPPSARNILPFQKSA